MERDIFLQVTSDQSPVQFPSHSVSDDMLLITLWDHDKFSKDDFMGQIMLDLSALPDEKDAWFPVAERAGSHDEVAGEVHLKILYVST